jgi:hypothetical protein
MGDSRDSLDDYPKVKTATEALMQSQDTIEYKLEYWERVLKERDELKAELDAVKTGKGIANPYLIKDQIINKLEAEVERLTNILGQDRLDDWKRIQDAEREVERLQSRRNHEFCQAEIQSLKDIAESERTKLSKAVWALDLTIAQLEYLPKLYPEMGDCNEPTIATAKSALKEQGNE